MKTKRILQVSALALAMSVATAQAADRIAFIPKAGRRRLLYQRRQRRERGGESAGRGCHL
ncbi:putative LacI-type transcriptional regulator [Klebsiella quasipneumoniae]|nr:putative LacI-type transcriptional regulator [Klebsiella quasipneumoniae]